MTMNESCKVPGFTAEASLGSSNHHYTAVLHVDGGLHAQIFAASALCACGYQSYNVCRNGQVYEHSFCRDENGQPCGETEVPTGNSC